MAYQPSGYPQTIKQQHAFGTNDPEQMQPTSGFAAAGGQGGGFARMDDGRSMSVAQGGVGVGVGSGVGGGGGGVGGVSASGDKRFPERSESQYRDWIFAVLFIVHLIGMFITAGVYGPDMLKYVRDQRNVPAQDRSKEDSMKTITILFVAAVVSSAFSGVWLTVMKRWADNIIHIGLGISCGLLVLAAVVCFAKKAFAMAIIYVCVAIFQGFYYYMVRARIPFAHATLAAASNAVQTSWGPVVVTYGLCFVNVGWLTFWAFTFAAVQHANENNGGTSQFALFFLLLSLFWTSMVIKNIGHVTTAGTVASFYFQPGLVKNVTANAFVRAITTSFGSICFGSLIVSFIQTCRAMIRMTRGGGGGNNPARECLACIADFLLGILERAIAYFNHYAYTQCAIYGYDFITASKRTWELMQQRLFTMIINDDLCGWALITGVLLGGVCSGMVGAAWAAAAEFTGWVGVGWMAFVVGCAVAALFMSVMDSAVVTTFVVWAEDPMTMATNQPDNYWRIARAAEPLYGVDPRMQHVQHA